MSDREFDTGPIWKPPSLTERNAQILIEEALLDKLPMRSVRRYLEVEFMRPISEIEEKIDLRKLVKKSRLPEADIQLRKFKTST